MAKKKDQGLDKKSRIHIHSRRYRLADPDGISGKAAIDGLVDAGILQDDSPEQIESVTYSQEKIRKGETEETIIDIQEESALQQPGLSMLGLR